MNLLLDILDCEYYSIYDNFKKKTLMGYFVGHTPPEVVIKAWAKEAWDPMMELQSQW
jgi:hypothetical protein